MKRSRHSDDEILTLLDEAKRGIPIDVICASAHISERTFYRWKRRLDGISPKGLEHLAKLEREVARLKRQLTMQGSKTAPSPMALARKSVESRPDIGAPLARTDDTLKRPAVAGARTGRFSSIRSGR